MRFDFPEHRLVLAAVGPFLIRRGRKSSCALSAAPSARYWSMTFIPITSGCWPPNEIFFGPVEVPPAPVSMRLPDDTTVEYVYHRPRADE